VDTRVAVTRDTQNMQTFNWTYMY